MQYRRFGKTNQWLSLFSLGTMRCLASPEVATATVQRAIALGINHLETAQGYGNSEVYLGKALSQLGIDRRQIYITTKILPLQSGTAMAQAIETSLQRLGLDYIDNLAIHGLNTWDHLQWVTAESGWRQAVQQAVTAGKVRHVGFSTHAFLEVILAAIATDLFEFVNLHYTYFFQRNQAAIALAQQKDMGVFIISPADKGGRLHTPPPQLEALCAPYSPLELTYRFLLSNGQITTLSVGAANPAELEAIAPLVDQNGPLTEVEQAALNRIEQHQQQALGNHHCQQCYDCLPCPEAIHIPEVLRLRNLAIAHGMTAFGQYRYGMFEQAGHWFPGNKASRCTDCGDCLPRCPEQLPIPALLRDAHERLQGKPRRRLWG